MTCWNRGFRLDRWYVDGPSETRAFYLCIRRIALRGGGSADAGMWARTLTAVINDRHPGFAHVAEVVARRAPEAATVCEYLTYTVGEAA